MVPGWNWSTDLQRLMEERRDLEEGETQVSAPGWNWHVNLVTRMEVRWYMEGSDASILESGFRWVRTCMELRHILKPGWVWDSGGLNLTCNFADLDGGETYIFNPDELEMVPGWSCDAICGPGWRWDVNKMEVKWKYKDVDWGEVLPGWGGEVNLRTCMEVRRPGRGWDGTRTELRQISWDLNKLWWD